MLAVSILLLVATASILLGTVFPLLVDVIWNETISIGPPYFNIVFVPIVLILIGLMLQFFNASQVIFTILVSTTLAAMFLYINFARIEFGAWIGVAAAISIVWSSYKRGSITMQIAHLGLAFMLLGISITPAYEIEKDLRLKVGDTVNIDKYAVSFTNIATVDGPNYVGFKSDFVINNNDKQTAVVHPEKRTYLFPQVAMSETAIYVGILQDIYIALGQRINKDTWAVRIYYKPYVRCIWLGASIMAVGAIWGIFHILRRKKVTTDCK